MLYGSFDQLMVSLRLCFPMSTLYLYRIHKSVHFPCVQISDMDITRTCSYISLVHTS